MEYRDIMTDMPLTLQCQKVQNPKFTSQMILTEYLGFLLQGIVQK